jgi:two-component system OmpR family sensor kinase
MASLRARLVASVLALAAAGLLLLGAVTYAEQKSFLTERVDQQARGAVGAVSQILDREGFLPAGSASHQNPFGSGQGDPDGLGAAVPPRGQPQLPPGTFGQRREADGRVLGHRTISFGSEQWPEPILPAHMPLNTYVTVESRSTSDLHYRAYAARDPEDSGITVVAVPLRDAEQTLSRLLLVEGLVIGGVLLALGLSAYVVVRLGLRPLDRIERTAGQIAAGQLSHRVSPANRKTEVGRLGLALNAMLDRLEEAFAERTASEERLRQFLADASHELRTPLSSIRGYAELFNMGAAADPESTELAMRRIEEEAKRMGVLVEDLLLLARLDETSDRPPEPVDVAALARDAVEDARATAPERTISLDAGEHAVVSGDAHQLQQVLANLLRNALVHTPAGTPIEVAVEREPESVTLTVRDHGPGLPAAARTTIFERFWRAEGGRERGRAGAGLGLAIARGVVEAHRGEISAADAPGGGALFVVRLPAQPVPTPAI